jgi:S1-C subfamily serine protease
MALDAAARVARATVRLTQLGGLGVLIPGGFIVTAAHCVEWTSTGGMSVGLGDVSRAEIVTADGDNLVGEVAAVEPVADIAVLAAPDGQVLYDAAEAFEAFCETTPAVPLCTTRFPESFEATIPLHILTHDKGLVAGRFCQGRIGARVLWMTSEQPIDGGTSGGPVVTEDGHLLGVLSSTSFIDGKHAANHTWPLARLDQALPVWLARTIFDAGGTDEEKR